MKIILSTVVALSLATPLLAETQISDGFIRNIEHELSLFGFRDVDASTLTNQQLGALHLKLSNSVSPFGFEAIRRKQEIKTILGWAK